MHSSFRFSFRLLFVGCSGRVQDGCGVAVFGPAATRASVESDEVVDDLGEVVQNLCPSGGSIGALQFLVNGIDCDVAESDGPEVGHAMVPIMFTGGAPIGGA
jgi:hypothetical protein